MNVWTKLLIGVGAATGIHYLLKINRTSQELESVATAKVHKLDLTGLTIRVDVQLKNPTKGSLDIKYPFIKIIYKDKLIGSSQVIDQGIHIPSYGEARIDSIMIQVPFTSLISAAPEVYKSLTAGTGIKAQVKTISAFDLGVKSLPYEKTEEVILSKANAV